MKLLEKIRGTVRHIMEEIAMLINEMSFGKIRPVHITISATLLHIVIAVAIIEGLYPAAALMLVVFGLMDALDGALARAQKSESELGVVLDATTDRIKETMLFAAIVFVFADAGDSVMAMMAGLALGGSIVVSYVKAKAETIVVRRHEKLSVAKANRLYGGGPFPYEIRMAVLVLGLLFDRLDIAIIVIAVGVWVTMLWRTANIWQGLGSE